MIPLIRTSVAVTLLLSSGCGPGGEPDSRSRDAGAVSGERPAPALPQRDEFVRNGLLPTASTRAQLARSLGEPDSVQAAAVPNRHVPGVTDTLFAVYYPGLLMRTHLPGEGSEIVAGVEVTGNRFLRYPLVGAHRSEVERAFGMPQEIRDGLWVYDCVGCGGVENPVEVAFAGDRVERVRFTYYVD